MWRGRIKFLVMVTMIALSFFAALALSGILPAFQIPFHTIDGGGRRSTGGNFILTGTIGQPDAGTMSGGVFTLDGGFWGRFSNPPANAAGHWQNY